MARIQDGGGGGNMFAGVSQGIRNVTSGVSRSAKRASTPKRRSSTGSGVGRVGRQASRGFNNIGRSVSRSYRSSAPRRSNSYGSGRNTGGQSFAARPPVGNTPSGTIARSVPAPPPKPPISIADFISGDNTYQTQSNAYKKALADYAAQMQAEQGKYTGEYNAQVSQLGLDRTQGLEDLQNDFASRGLLTSGVYADAQGDFNKKFDTSLADLSRAKTAYMDDLTTGQTNFSATQKAMLDKAYQDALNRRLDQIKG